MAITVVIFDTETTGLTLPSLSPLNEQPRIIEIGMRKLIFTIEGFCEGGNINELIDPQQGIATEITEITGIKNEELKGRPTFAEFAPTLEEFLNGVDVIIAHNAPFDMAMLTNEMQRCGVHLDLPSKVVCSAQEATHLMGWRPSLKDFYKYATGEELAQTHRAIDDVNALVEALVKLDMLGAICVST